MAATVTTGTLLATASNDISVFAAHEEVELAGNQQHAVVVVRAARHDGDVEPVFPVGAVGHGLEKSAVLGLGDPVGSERDLVQRVWAPAGDDRHNNGHRPAINARGKRAGFMIGLRRSFWPMIGSRLDAGRAPFGRDTNYLANLSKETFRSMTSAIPPRDWTDIHWPEIAGRRAGALDCGPAAGGNRTAWPAFAVGTDVMIAQAYLARVRELLPETIPATFLPAAAGRDFHRAHRLSGHADAADRSGAEELDGARRQASRAQASKSS